MSRGEEKGLERTFEQPDALEVECARYAVHFGLTDRASIGRRQPLPTGDMVHAGIWTNEARQLSRLYQCAVELEIALARHASARVLKEAQPPI